jgi:hypothetical protein
MVLGQVSASDLLSDNGMRMLVILGGIMIAMVAIITSTVRKVMATRAREETKRELAAYVAEGSMTLDQAERIIRADKSPLEQGSPQSKA